MKFSAKQIDALKQEFAVINAVNPDHLPKFHAMFDEMEDETLVQVVKAGIKFLSKLGLNAATRRGIQVY